MTVDRRELEMAVQALDKEKYVAIVANSTFLTFICKNDNNYKERFVYRQIVRYMQRH